MAVKAYREAMFVEKVGGTTLLEEFGGQKPNTLAYVFDIP